MKVDFAFICDYAEATNKINALGIGFDRIYARELPTKHRHFSVVVQLRATLMEAGEKNIEVRLIDEDGNDVLPPARVQLNIPKPEGKIESTGRFVMEFGNVEFKRYGIHSVRVAIDGTEMVAIPFGISLHPSGSK
jgi:hypothetical protein